MYVLHRVSTLAYSTAKLYYKNAHSITCPWGISIVVNNKGYNRYTYHSFLALL